jgi:diacylglycerol kinase (ATP)
MQGTRGPVILVVSPHAGRTVDQAMVAAALRAAGVEVGRVVDVTTLDERMSQAQTWKDEGFAAAVAAGGDGTVGAVASHVAGSGMPLGILPVGSANDVARSLGVPLGLKEACAAVAWGTEYTMDLGYARPAQTEPGAVAELAEESAASTQRPDVERRAALASAGAYFLHALTVGLNVEFARLATDVARRQRWGALTYLASAIQALGRFRTIPVEMRLEGVVAGAYGVRALPEGVTQRDSGFSVERADTTRTITGDVIQIAAVITPVFGGASNFRLPDVALTDQLIDFVVIEALAAHHLQNLIERIGVLLGAGTATGEDKRGRGDVLTRLNLPGLWRFKARSARIIQPADLDVTLDGDIRSRTPLDISIAANALRVLLPAARGEEDGRD